ncbi:DUF397 domain-containing protein [Actinoallomurus rhizosphaericola]|nr:DUF397 domain-containing protein [Actinoallomurus rhizosphaericola]MCO5999524.1 DUF397 domain-containing protein [Actinoallomurus rhizosphaericola]
MIDFRKSTYSGGSNTDCVEVAAGSRDEIE